MRHQESDVVDGKMLGVFAIGIVIGSVATLLLTPQSGRDSREQIRDYVRRKGEDLNDLQEKTVETYQDIVSGTHRGLEEIQVTIKEAVHAGMDEFRKEWKDVNNNR
ncbi:YtxH domain-containing protein [uncultured Nitrospira sp.]|uniref:YtxH domain-containing protein n=1 Tax=uncultured Nitrospira sp. TaxID=157176 RepID=UPI003140842B